MNLEKIKILILPVVFIHTPTTIITTNLSIIITITSNINCKHLQRDVILISQDTFIRI